MLTLTDSSKPSGQMRRARRRRNARTAAQPTGSNGNAGGAVVQSEKLALTQKSQQRNPFEGTAPGFSTVKVDAWGKGENSSIEGILLKQGYTRREIYSKSENGKTLLDEVGRVNNLRNVNLIRAGQDLVIPSKQAAEAPAQAQTETPKQEPKTQPQVSTPEPAAQNQKPEAKVNAVKVDRWGQGPNSSLGAILKNQGFDEKDIYRQDANGDSLLKQVARANGLKNPNHIQAGQTLQIPNSQEALGQMDIPEMPKATPKTQPQQTEQPVRKQPEARTETPAKTETPAQTENTKPVPSGENTDEVTANMGMLLDGVKQEKFTREEFQYLNARSSRYAQMRARFSNDGFSNSELQDLGKMERRYGIEFARLSQSDDVKLPQFPSSSNDPEKAIQVKHYHESGPLFDRYRNGNASTEDALNVMVNQRSEARRQEVK